MTLNHTKSIKSDGARNFMAADLDLTAVTSLTTASPLYLEGRPLTIAAIAGVVIGMLASRRY